MTLPQVILFIFLAPIALRIVVLVLGTIGVGLNEAIKKAKSLPDSEDEPPA